jgi:hypothetical protein
VSSAELWRSLNLPAEFADALGRAPSVTVYNSKAELLDVACGGAGSATMEVAYDVPGRGRIVEAVVNRVRNGVSANYPEPYMRRRDPDCMYIGDDGPTDKPTYAQVFGKPFDELRSAALGWLSTQPLACFAFRAGQPGMGVDAAVIAPANAGFFALGLAMLQGILDSRHLDASFVPRLIIAVAPSFRHTHFNGKQAVVHNRLAERHELFSFNLYPGPSAKKGVYGALLHLGEREGWVTAHCSTVQVVTPYDNIVTFMHEGASGGGKSEMLEVAHRESDGRVLIGENVVTGETRHLEIPRFCDLRPVTDDMALCHPSLQEGDGKLSVTDAESAWFVRVNHIRQYATDPHLERLTAQPPEPLLFLNIDAVPNSRAMIWEHIEDAPGRPCPNPRVIVPRQIVHGVVNEGVSVDIRSLGLRTPPCTKERPSYGILGIFHVLPPALAWLWRLVAPRGYANPSITSEESLASEGVGSYWPFATGRQVDQANLLLRQIQSTPRTRYVLCPNQHVGAWACGFAPQWIAREYLARRGTARFREGQLQPSRCQLLGYHLADVIVEGRMIPKFLVQVHVQPEVGEDAYDEGANILYSYFRRHLTPFLCDELDDLGRQIIEGFLDGGTLHDLEWFIPQA